MRVETLDYKRDAEFVCGSAVTHGVFKPRRMSALIFLECQVEGRDMNQWTNGVIEGDPLPIVRQVIDEFAERTGAIEVDAAGWISEAIFECLCAEATETEIVQRLRSDPRCKAAVRGVSGPETTKILRALAARPQRSLNNAYMKAVCAQNGVEIVLLRGKEPCEASDEFYGVRMLPDKCPEPPYAGCDVLNCTCRFSGAPREEPELEVRRAAAKEDRPSLLQNLMRFFR